MNEVSRTRKELSFANKRLDARAKVGSGNPGKENVSTDRGDNGEDIQRSMRLVETIGIQKKVLENENEELRSRISALENSRHEVQRGYGAMADRSGFGQLGQNQLGGGYGHDQSEVTL